MRPPFAVRTVIALAVSMGLPPPSATSPSNSSSRMISAPRSTTALVGSGTVSANTRQGAPACSNSAATRSTSPISRITGSLTSSGRRMPRLATSPGSSASAPPPISTWLGRVRRVAALISPGLGADHAALAQRLLDVGQRAGILDRGGQRVFVAIGDAEDRAAEDLARARLGQARHDDRSL